MVTATWLTAAATRLATTATTVGAACALRTFQPRARPIPSPPSSSNGPPTVLQAAAVEDRLEAVDEAEEAMANVAEA